MLTLKGKGVFGGIAIGPANVLVRNAAAIERVNVKDSEAEVARFHAAREEAKAQLAQLFEKALAEVGEENAAIFEIHQMMLDDLDYIEAIEGMVRDEKINAEFAVNTTADNFAEMFASMEDEYMQARSADVKDISKRVISCLQKKNNAGVQAGDKYILTADDLAPSETIQLDKEKVLGFVTAGGSANSHTAILARTLAIPAVVNTLEEVPAEYNGLQIIIDGYKGIVIVDPDENTLHAYIEEYKKDQEKKALLATLKGQPSVTHSGQKINVYANIGNTSDLDKVLANDAEGIGLFRSEFIYLKSDNYPTEEFQFNIYKEVAEGMKGKKVIIRTLDIGADKQADYFNLPHEDNPALGYRAIRICLTRPEIFKTQLRAILRASAFGKLAIMFPMIISVEEVLKCKAILKQVMVELDAKGIGYDKDIEIGIMVETPAAAVMTDELGKHVDFFSIGTNDLTQYTLAIDRQNQDLEEFFDAHNPAVLRLIEMTVKNAHANGIWAGICGELGADLTLTESFVKMGMDELSVAPGAVLPLRAKIRSL